MILYHYAALQSLPAILKEGLWKGEISTPNLHQNLQALSLTTQTDPDTLRCWGSQPFPEKTAVRYVCDVDPADKRLEAQRECWKRLNLPPRWCRLQGGGQSKWWYFYHGTIAPENFKVEMRGKGGYVPVPDPERFVPEIQAARDKFREERPYPWMLSFVRIDPDDHSGDWIFEEVCAAERFGLTRAVA